MDGTQWGREHFSAATSTAIMYNWILKNWLFSRDKRWIRAFIYFLFPPLRRLEASLPRCVLQAHHGNLAKVISLSGSFCTLCYFFPPRARSCLSLSIFHLRRSRQGTLLCFVARCLFWLVVWHQRVREALTDSHAVFPLLRSQPVGPTPACLVQLSSQGTWQSELFRSQSNRKSMKTDFLYSEGVR